MPETYLEPAGDHIIVVDVDRKQTIDGIELPDNVRQQDMVYGYVVSVGPLACTNVKPKETICYGPYAGKNVNLDGVQFRILREGQIEAWIRTKQTDQNPGR